MAFSGKDYTLALTKYSAALKLKSEAYPKDQINKIESLQAKEKEAKALAAKEAEVKKKYDVVFAKEL